VKNGEHTCNTDDLATAKLLDSDTKQCPKCATGIFKIEGCDQMWCTQCHTAFSWIFGNIDLKSIHNPHFYEWQRRNGPVPRAVGDIVCARELDHYLSTRIHTRTDFAFGLQTQTVFLRAIDDIIQATIHLRDVEMPDYLVVENKVPIRIAYLRQNITEGQFVAKLHLANKQQEKNREIAEVLQMFVQTITEILYRLEDEPYGLGLVITKELYLNEIEALRTYANECLVDIAHTYGHKPKTITLNSRYHTLNFIK